MKFLQRAIYCTTAAFLLSIAILQAQESNWIADYSTRSVTYPADVYFTGFMSQYVKKGDDLNAIKASVLEQAKVQLSEGIRVKIESNIVNKMSSINAVTLDEFEKVSKSYSRIDLVGAQAAVYFDARKKTVMAFVWVAKREVVEHYCMLLHGYYEKALAHTELGEQFLSDNRAEALRNFHSCRRFFSLAEEAQTVLLICGVDNAQLLLKDKISALKTIVAHNLAQTESAKDLSIPKLAKYLAVSLKLQIDTLNGEKVELHNITYRDSNAGSEFSNRFSELLKIAMVEESFNVVFPDSRPVFGQLRYWVSGTFWEDGNDRVQVVIGLQKEDESGERTLLAGLEGWTTKSAIQASGLELKPDNYFAAYEKKKLFAEKELDYGGAKLEVWSNKGKGGLIFKEGEKMRISVRMNQTGYVRLVNYWADGTQTLLVDNYFIDYRKVNRVIQLPFEWQITCPCGVEFIQANAQNVEYVPLEVESKEGINFITDDINSILISNRKMADELLNSGGFSVENRLVLTTIR